MYNKIIDYIKLKNEINIEFMDETPDNIVIAFNKKLTAGKLYLKIFRLNCTGEVQGAESLDNFYIIISK
jgi:hypothetical protein